MNLPPPAFTRRTALLAAAGALAPLLGAGLVVAWGYESSFYATIVTMTIALGVLAAAGHIDPRWFDRLEVAGELSLDAASVTRIAEGVLGPWSAGRVQVELVPAPASASASSPSSALTAIPSGQLLIFSSGICTTSTTKRLSLPSAASMTATAS